MFFGFIKTDGKADGNSQDPPVAENGAPEESIVEKDAFLSASSAGKKLAEKKSAVEKESSLAEKKDAESRKDRLKKQSNSKVECRNPECTESALYAYSGEFDDEGEATMTSLYCLNCGFGFPYFEEFEKEEKKTDDGSNLGVGFLFLVAMVFAVIAIKGDENGGFFNQDTSPPNSQVESLRSPQNDTSQNDTFQSDAPVRILNDAPPFVIRDNN
ncbi:MAG: hypothetical protein WA947_22985 [Phormidesmis sp.]